MWISGKSRRTAEEKTRVNIPLLELFEFKSTSLKKCTISNFVSRIERDRIFERNWRMLLETWSFSSKKKYIKTLLKQILPGEVIPSSCRLSVVFRCSVWCLNNIFYIPIIKNCLHMNVVRELNCLIWLPKFGDQYHSVCMPRKVSRVFGCVSTC
jgi:hypothetical protein